MSRALKGLVFLVGVIVVFLIFVDSASAQPGYQTRSCGKEIHAPSWEVRFVEIVNDKRASLGRGRLCVDSILMRSSQAWTNHLAKTNSFYHGGHERIQPVYGMNNFGKAFENCGYGAKDMSPQEAFKNYLDSPSHRQALLGKERKKIGVGVKNNGSFRFNVVHLTRK